jgi:hypothetical protein
VGGGHGGAGDDGEREHGRERRERAVDILQSRFLYRPINLAMCHTRCREVAAQRIWTQLLLT